MFVQAIEVWLVVLLSVFLIFSLCGVCVDIENIVCLDCRNEMFEKRKTLFLAASVHSLLLDTRPSQLHG